MHKCYIAVYLPPLTGFSPRRLGPAPVGVLAIMVQNMVSSNVGRIWISDFAEAEEKAQSLRQDSSVFTTIEWDDVYLGYLFNFGGDSNAEV